MFKLLLVDDKANVVKGIMKMADWTSYNIEVMGSASNGREALALMRENVPDIIITDIYMPIMDGLELSRAVLKKRPCSKIILLSGYDKFEYAQKAIELGIFKYLLKPVGIDKIVEAVCQARDALVESQKEQEIKDYFLKNRGFREMDTSRCDLLHQLICGDEALSGEYLFTMLNDIGFKLKIGTKGFFVLVLCCESINGRPVSADIQNTAGLANKVCRLIEEITPKELPCIAYEEKDGDIVAIINTADIEEKNVDKNIAILAHNYIDVLGSKLEVKASIGVGKWYVDICNVRQSYKEACMALSCRFTMGSGNVISINQILSEKTQMDGEIFCHIKKLIGSISSHSANEMDKCIDDLICYVEHYRILMPHILKGIFHNIISVICWEFSNNNEFLCEYFKDVDLYDGMNNAGDYEKLKKSFQDTMHLLKEGITLGKQMNTDDAVKIAKNYIINHLSGDLSLEKISTVVHLHPVYFTRIFKQKEGRTFSDYVKQARMEKAKELLSKSEEKIMTVAQAVGFADRRYFSDVFKSVTGLTPSEYKEQYSLEIADKINISGSDVGWAQ